MSEVMLQQTRVATVISYYEKWMLAFPDIPTLARASIDVFTGSLIHTSFDSNTVCVHVICVYVCGVSGRKQDMGRAGLLPSSKAPM